MARIAFFGAGYAGLVSGACLAELGHEVVIRDVSADRIEALQAGRIPFHEPGLAELVESNRERLSFTLSMEEAVTGSQFLFVCVGTPPTASGDANLSAVWSVVEELPAGLEDVVLVMKSTVPVGTGEKVRAELDRRGLSGVGYASCPEFLAEGTAVRDFMESDRVVVGSFEDADGDAVSALHDKLGAPVVRMDVPSAEMVKLAANAYLATRISFINEIANVCELVGADVEDVAHGMGLDRRIGTHYLRAGLGFGGSCLVGEETVLIRKHGRERIVTLASLFEELADGDPAEVLVEADDVEVMSWEPGAPSPEFLPMELATRRPYAGEILEVRVDSGRSVRTTPDHPFVVLARDGAIRRKLAQELKENDLIPVTDLPLVPRPDQAVFAGSAGVGQPQLAVRAVLPELRVREVKWARFESAISSEFSGYVYSMEVPGPHTFLTGDGLVLSNCFPKDVSFLKLLAGNSGYHFHVVTAVMEVNELQMRRPVAKLQKHLGSLAGKRIALLGLAFKPDTDDLREAPSLVLTARLLAEGADVVAWDPVADARATLRGVEFADTAADALRGADAAVVVTEWPELRDLAWAELRGTMRNPLVIDGRNHLDAAAMRADGFAYEGMGRAASPFAALAETPEPESKLPQQ